METLSLTVRFADKSAITVGAAERYFDAACLGWRVRRSYELVDAEGELVDGPCWIGQPPGSTAGQALDAAVTFALADAERDADGWAAAHEGELADLMLIIDSAVAWAERARQAEPAEAWGYAAWLASAYGGLPATDGTFSHLRTWHEWQAEVIAATVAGTPDLLTAELAEVGTR